MFLCNEVSVTKASVVISLSLASTVFSCMSLRKGVRSGRTISGSGGIYRDVVRLLRVWLDWTSRLILSLDLLRFHPDSTGGLKKECLQRIFVKCITF